MARVARLLAAAILAGPGCTLFGAEDTGGGPCVHDPALSWSNFGEQFMVQSCQPCHSAYLPSDRREGAPLGVDFDTYEDVLERADRIAVRSTGADADMPPGGGPTDQDRANLAEWLQCGVADDAATLSGGTP